MPTITAKTTDAANRTSDAIAANRRFTTSPIHEVASHDRKTIGLSAVPFSSARLRPELSPQQPRSAAAVAAVIPAVTPVIAPVLATVTAIIASVTTPLATSE
jgi:hypothetical protein